MCTSVIWYLSYGRHREYSGERFSWDYGEYLLDVASAEEDGSVTDDAEES